MLKTSSFASTETPKAPTTAAVEQAREALALAEAQAAREVQEARREAARRVQIEHDKAQTAVVAELERKTAAVLADAAKVKTGKVTREASIVARKYLTGSATIEHAMQFDPTASMLAGHAIALGAEYERLAGFGHRTYRHGDIRVGAELAQRLTDIERATWGAVLRRMRVLSGEIA